MKLKENDKIPNSEIFVIEGDDPIKKNIELSKRYLRLIILRKSGDKPGEH